MDEFPPLSWSTVNRPAPVNRLRGMCDETSLLLCFMETLSSPRGTSCSQYLPPCLCLAVSAWESLWHRLCNRGCFGMGYGWKGGAFCPQQGPSGHGPSSAAQALGTACRGCRPDASRGSWVCPASEQKENNRMFPSVCRLKAPSPEGKPV